MPAIFLANRESTLKMPVWRDFNTTHALKCQRGGFVNACHDNIRDIEYRLLQEVCTDVETEPHLQLQKVVN